MTSRLSFPTQALNRFSFVEQRLQQGSKGLSLISSYFTNVTSEIDKFSKTLTKSLAPLNQFTQINKAGNDSLTVAMKTIIKNMEDFFGVLNKMCFSLKAEINEPLALFVNHYDQCNKVFLKEASKIIDSLNSYKSKVVKAKERYSKVSKTYLISSRDEPEVRENKRKQMEEVKAEYQQTIASHNLLLNEKQILYRQQLEMVQNNEETRISTIAKKIEKLFAVTTQFLTEFYIANDNIKKTLATVNTPNDIELIVSEMMKTPKQFTFDRVVFEDKGDVFYRLNGLAFESINKDPVNNTFEKKEASPSVIVSEDVVTEDVLESNEEEKNMAIMENEISTVQKFTMQLLSNKGITNEEKMKIAEIFKTRHGREAFFKTISQINNRYLIEDNNVFETLGEIVKNFLTMYALFSEKDPAVLSAVITFGFFVYTNREDNGVKSDFLLRELISESSIWNNKDRWISMMQYRIAKSLTRFKIPISPQGKDHIKDSKEDMTRRNVVFSDLSQFAVQLALMSIEQNMGRELLIQFASYYGITLEKLCQILSDYESAAPLQRDIQPGKKELIALSLKAREKRMNKYQGEKLAFIIGNSLKYVGDSRTMGNVLRLNKKLNGMLKQRIHKKVLLLPGIKPEIRPIIWKQTICDPKLVKIYYEIKEDRLFKYIYQLNGTSDVIKLDVIRSFSSCDEATQQAIIDVLRCYAISHPQIDYCQGMNFLAGLFYLIYRDEGISYSMFATLISKFELDGLYKQDVPLLSKYIYYMNRLIAVYFPTLHVHLYEEGLNAMYFCSAWFLTSFTYVLQYNKDSAIPPLLFALFDKYIFSGFKKLLQMALFILEKFEKELLAMRYEQIVQFLNEVSKTDFFRSPIIIQEFQKSNERYSINKELMKKLKEEQSYIADMSEKFTNIAKPKTADFKHYINTDGKIVAVYFPN